jgi:predicted Zn-dependent protease
VVRRGGALLGRFVHRPWRTLAVLALLALTGTGAALAGIEGWALYHFRAARLAVERYHNLEARDHLTACLHVWPHDTATLLLAARTARRMGTFDEAEVLLDRCRDRAGNEDLAMERLLLQAQRGDVDTASKICRDLVEKDHPATPLILEALAYGFMSMYRMQEAAFVLHLWLERQPDNTQAILFQGILYASSGKHDEAGAAFARVVELDPEHDEARLRLADHLVESGQASDALPHVEYLRRRQSNDLDLQVSLARCRDLLGQEAEAERLLDGVLARQPDFAPALAERGKLAMRDGQLAEAERLLRAAAAQDSGDFQLHYRLYQCLVQNGKTDEAQEERARLRQLEADLRRINEIMTRQMQQTPHDAALHYEVGTLTLRSGTPKEAVRWFQSALKEDPDYAPAHKALADYYQRIGRAGEAARHRELAQQADPSGQAGAPAEQPGR